MQDLNPSNFKEHEFYRISCWTLLTLSLISSLVLIDIPSFSIVVAQQFSSGLSEPVMKVLLKDAITALNNGNTTKTLQNLDVFNQMLTEVKENSSSIQATKLLIQDTFQAIHNGDVSRAIVYLNLVGQQFGIQQAKSEFNFKKKYKFILFIVTKYFLSASLHKMHHFQVTNQQSKK